MGDARAAAARDRPVDRAATAAPEHPRRSMGHGALVEFDRVVDAATEHADAVQGVVGRTTGGERTRGEIVVRSSEQRIDASQQRIDRRVGNSYVRRTARGRGQLAASAFGSAA